MSDAQINPDEPQGQHPRGDQWTGGAGVPDPTPAAFDALEGTGEPESSWLLEDDGFDLVVSPDQVETEPVQPLPTELDALQEQAVAPTWSEEALLGDDPMVGASYVEPETASSVAMRALVPAGLCMVLSFGAIGVWSLVEDGVQSLPDDVTAELEIEGPARAESEPEVELVTPEIGNPIELGRLSYQRDGAIVPADSYGTTAARSTVDTPREPGELPPTPAATKNANASAQAERSTGSRDIGAGTTELDGAADAAGTITPATGSVAEDVTVTAGDPSTPEAAARAADPHGTELTEVEPTSEDALPGAAPAGEDVALQGDAPTTDGVPGSTSQDVEPVDFAKDREVDASSDDAALAGSAAAEEQERTAADPTPDPTMEFAEIEPTPADPEVRVAPLPGDETLSAFALRFPGPGFGPAWPSEPELLAAAPPAPEPMEDAGPAAAVLPFGFFEDDVSASVDVDPEFVMVELEVAGPEPAGVAGTGAPEPREFEDALIGADDAEPTEVELTDAEPIDAGTTGEELIADAGVVVSLDFNAPWIPLEIVMDSFDGDRSFGVIGSETIEPEESEIGPESRPGAAEETIDADLEFDDDESFPAPVTVDIVVHDGGESGDSTAWTDEESFDAFEDDEEYPAPVTVEIVVPAEEDLTITEEVDRPASAVAGAATESVAADALERCRGEAVAHDRLDAIFGPASHEGEAGGPLVSDVFPAPASGAAASNAVVGPAVELPMGPAAGTTVDTATSIHDEVEVEVRPGLAGENGAPRYRGVVRRISTENIWPHSTVPESEVGGAAFVLTPNVGDVRVVLDGGETIDGRLHGVGQNRIVLDTRLGRLSIDGRRASRIDRFGRKATRPSTGVVNTKGLDMVRVMADGGIFQGHLLSRENGRVTLLLEQGMRITLESDVVEPAVGNGSVSRIRRDD